MGGEGWEWGWDGGDGDLRRENWKARSLHKKACMRWKEGREKDCMYRIADEQTKKPIELHLNAILR